MLYCRQIDQGNIGIMEFKIRILILLLAGSINWAVAQKAVAVIDFEPINLSAGEALALTERFRTEIQSLDTVNVYIDRNSMQSVLTEQGFQQSGCSSDECAVEMGQMLGAELIVVGSIGLIGSTYSVNVRSIDVENGKILRTASRDFRGEIDYVLTPGMQMIARQFLEQTQPVVTSGDRNRPSATNVSQQIDRALSNIQPYWDEVRKRTTGPEVFQGDDTYETAVRDARYDVDNEKWLLGPGCAGAGCGTCNPFFGFSIVPVTLSWALFGDVYVPARRWKKINNLDENQKSTYLKTYKAQVRRTRFQKTLYGTTGGFILGAIVYSWRK